MKTCTAYHALAAQQKQLLWQLTDRCTKAVTIQRLYLLGLSTAAHRTEGLFTETAGSQIEATHGWLLAVVDEESTCDLNGTQNKLEAHMQQLLAVTVVVLSEASFSRWLAEGHPFACAVAQHGYLLHQNKDHTFSGLGSVVEETERLRFFKQAKSKVAEFLAGAELYTLRLQYGLGAFMVHQAAEQALCALLFLRTGLRLITHKTDRLVRWCTLVCPELATTFSGTGEGADRLSGLLRKAYIEARYNGDYRIKREDLMLLTERVKRLEEILKGCRPTQVVSRQNHSQ